MDGLPRGGTLPSNEASLIDAIYEASVSPGQWPGVLDALAAIAGAEGTLLFAPGIIRPSWIASPAITSRIELWATSKWARENPRAQRLVPMREPRFLTDLDAFTPEEIEEAPYYTDFLRPHGLGWCAGTTIHSPTGDSIIFSIERAYKHGPVPSDAVALLDRLRPHLARSSLLTARIGLDRLRLTVDVLASMGLPAAVLSHEGKALVTNDLMLGSAPAIRIGANDVVSFANDASEKLWKQVRAMGDQGHSAVGHSIPVPATATTLPSVAHLVPLLRSARDLFVRATAVLYVTTLSGRKVSDSRILEALFDLTPAEARVTALLASGESVDGIAKAQNLTRETVRGYLKSVFMKTGARRQAELVALVASSSAAGRSE